MRTPLLQPHDPEEDEAPARSLIILMDSVAEESTVENIFGSRNLVGA